MILLTALIPTVLWVKGLLGLPLGDMERLGKKLEAVGYRVTVVSCVEGRIRSLAGQQFDIVGGHSCGADVALSMKAKLIITMDTTIACLGCACPMFSTCLNYYTSGHPTAGYRVTGAGNIHVPQTIHWSLAREMTPRIVSVLGPQVFR